MTKADAAYTVFIAIGLGIDALVIWPAFLRRSQVDPARARIWLWSMTIILLWTLVAPGVVLWIVDRRDFAELRLVAPHGWRIWGTIALTLLVVVFYAQTASKIIRARRSKKRIKFANEAARRAPHTSVDLAWWLALSVSAGICEEFICRGYLIWLFTPILGLWGAAAVSLIIFAAAHSYQGAKGVVATGVVGGFLTLIVLGFGSLVPAMAVHAFIDAGEGFVSWLALHDAQTVPDSESGVGEPLIADH